MAAFLRNAATSEHCEEHVFAGNSNAVRYGEHVSEADTVGEDLILVPGLGERWSGSLQGAGIPHQSGATALEPDNASVDFFIICYYAYVY